MFYEARIIMDAEIKITIDADEVYASLSWQEKEKYVDSHIDDASTDALVTELERRGYSVKEEE